MRSYIRRVISRPWASSAGTVALTVSIVRSLRAVAIRSSRPAVDPRDSAPGLRQGDMPGGERRAQAASEIYHVAPVFTLGQIKVSWDAAPRWPDRARGTTSV